MNPPNSNASPTPRTFLQASVYWGASAMICLLCAGLIYVGGILVFMAPLLTSRGNIDYPDFSPAQRRRAKIETILVFTSGFIPLGIAYLGITRRRRLLNHLLGAPGSANPDYLD